METIGIGFATVFYLAIGVVGLVFCWAVASALGEALIEKITGRECVIGDFFSGLLGVTVVAAVLAILWGIGTIARSLL